MNPVTNKELLITANSARKNCYIPYSKYPVGAALLTKSGKVFTGVNIENAAYPSGVCAERVAIFKAVSEGETEFSTLALVTSSGGFPCGSCRQVMSEFGLDIKVIIGNENNEILVETTVNELLPGAFTSKELN